MDIQAEYSGGTFQRDMPTRRHIDGVTNARMFAHSRYPSYR